MENNNRQDFQKRSKQPQSRLLNFDTSKILNDATSIVETAASILEEEIAAGIIAASNLEKKVIDPEKVRSSDPDDLMRRFRGDAHEVVDMLMDLIVYSTESMKGLNQKIITSAGSGPGVSNGGMTILRSEKPLKPGESTSIPLMLENDSDSEEMEVSFGYPDLVNADNETISRRNVKMKPDTLKIAPLSKGKMEIEIKAPKSAKPGTYNMMIRDKNLKELKAVIEVDVVE